MRWRTRVGALVVALVVGLPLLLAVLHLTLASALVVCAVAVVVTALEWLIGGAVARRRAQARTADRAKRASSPA